MKKRLVSTLLVFCMVLALLPTTAWAAIETYTVSAEGGNIYISYEEWDGQISRWVSDCDESVTSAVIPSNVYKIGERAFQNRKLLENIVIPDSVTDLGDYTFSGCSSLSTVTIPKGVTIIGRGIFNDCTSLINVSIPDGVTTIWFGAFWGCTSLEEIAIPDTVTLIGVGAFWGCSNLNSIVLPDELTDIWSNAFYDCTNLSQIYISDNLSKIEGSAFHGCENLSDVYYAGSEEQWNNIAIGSDNDPLTSATIHYNWTDTDPNPPVPPDDPNPPINIDIPEGKYQFHVVDYNVSVNFPGVFTTRKDSEKIIPIIPKKSWELSGFLGKEGKKWAHRN